MLKNLLLVKCSAVKGGGGKSGRSVNGIYGC